MSYTIGHPVELYIDQLCDNEGRLINSGDLYPSFDRRQWPLIRVHHLNTY